MMIRGNIRNYAFIEVAVFAGLIFFPSKCPFSLRKGKIYFALLAETLHCKIGNKIQILQGFTFLFNLIHSNFILIL